MSCHAGLVVDYSGQFATDRQDTSVISYPFTLGDQNTRILEPGIGSKAIVHGLGARGDGGRRNIRLPDIQMRRQI